MSIPIALSLTHEDKLTSTQRVCLVVRELIECSKITNSRIRELTGLTSPGAFLMISQIATIIPVYWDVKARVWRILDD
jgi:hypothetical protein